MKKELKDYLPFHLGCEVLIPTNGVINRLVAIIGNPNEEILLETAILLKVKIILRPLSDMTDEEAVELIRVDHSEKDYPIMRYVEKKDGNILFTAKDERMKHSVVFSVGFRNQFAPDEMRYLLSKHFDIFGLIEAGLAIDKTTLNQSL